MKKAGADMRRAIAGMAITLGMATATPAAAATMVATYTGMVTSGTDHGWFSSAPGKATDMAGKSYVATFRFDVPAPAAAPETDGGLMYRAWNRPVDWAITIDGTTKAGTSTGLMQIGDNQPYYSSPKPIDALHHSADINPAKFWEDGLYFYISRDNPDGSRSFTNGGSFAQSISYSFLPGDYVAAGYHYTQTQAEVSQLSLSIATLSVTSAVPEPASWGLMIAGFGAVGGTMRVRRRRVAFA